MRGSCLAQRRWPLLLVNEEEAAGIQRACARQTVSNRIEMRRRNVSRPLVDVA